MLDRENTVAIACEIFTRELEYLQRQGMFTLPVVYLDSMLHMQPKKLALELNRVIEQQRAQHKQILLLFGDCHARMFEIEQAADVARLDGSNCIEIILGEKRYRQIRQRKSFVLMGEWALRWEEIFTLQLGLDRPTAQQFMPEYHSELLYLDNGFTPLPKSQLAACSEFCNLPWRTESTSPKPLFDGILQAFEKLTGPHG